MSQADILLEHLTVTAHEHNVIDDDVAFIVDPVTRKISTSNPDRYVLVQGDHNSKVFSFKIPRYIEGHDMALCDKVKVLYNNVKANSKEAIFTDGVYETSDLHIIDKNTVGCSWTISDNATEYEGTLHFALLFLCMDGPIVTYRWGTDFYDEVVVLKKLGSEISFQLNHLDVIEQWKARVKAEFSAYIDQTVDSDVAIAKAELNEQLHADMDIRYAEISKVVVDKHTEIDNQIDAFDDILRREITNIDDEVDVLKTRMDTFTKLPEGSTAGDAELNDIRVGVTGKLYESAGAAVREQFNAVDDMFNTSSNSMILKDFVKQNNIAKVIDVTRTNSDGTTRTITANAIDKSKGVIDGKFLPVSSYMPMTDYISLEAGKTYTVYVYDESHTIDYNMFMYTSTGGTYTEGGKNKVIATAVYKPLNIIKPEVSGSYCLGIYLDFEGTFYNDNIHVYVVEGEYTFEDFTYLNTKEHDDMIYDNMSELNAIPDAILENNMIVMIDNNVITNRVVTRSAKRYSDVLTAFNGEFKLGTVTPIAEKITLKANTVYTAFAISKMNHKGRIVFLADNGASVLNNNGVNITLTAVGLSQFKSNVGGEVQAALYSAVDQTLENESLALYIVEGAYETKDFHKYVTTVDLEDYMMNADDLNLFKKEILDDNMITMVGSYLYNGAAYAVPSVIDRSVTKINGAIHNLRLTNEFNLVAGKTYTVCVIDNVKDTNYHIFFGDHKTNIAIQMNGINKGFGVNNGTHCGLFTPDTSNTAYAYIYNDSEADLHDRYLRLIVVEGEYTYDELINKYEEDNGFDYTSYNLPIVRLTGDTTGMSKDNKVTLNYIYGNRRGTCAMKWQGSSSIGYPKKNYTITFDKAFEAAEGWGEQKKYCLKANWIDFSHARNVVSAKLWGQIVKSRAVKNDKLYDLPNGGAIDGFPVMVVINDIYQGLYTFNIPKDGWMFGMGDDINEFVVVADAHTDATRFKAETTVEEVENESTFAIEYIPDGVETETVVASLNTLIDKCINSTGTKYRESVAPYIDIDSAIDYYIFACMLTAADGTDKNYLLGTYDGVKWFFSAYDLDTTFGNCWDGKSYYSVTAGPTFRGYKNAHRLMHLIYTYDKAALKARYAELRATVLSEANIMNTFYNFLVDIPKALFDEEVKIWPGIPGTHTNNVAQIINYYMMRCKAMDAEIEAL